jgi:2-dehydropantoate 2-reductase
VKVCVYGAGAAGGHFAVRLAASGHDVSVVARGPHLAAIQEHGLSLRIGAEVINARLAASDDPSRFGPQDLVIVAVKATALAAVADQIGPLVRSDSHVLFPQNGMTWWYRHGLPRNLPNPPDIPIFALADRFLRRMRANQVVGGLIYSANEVEAPGVVKNDSPGDDRLEIGPINGGETRAIANIRARLEDAGIRSPNPGDIRAAMWTKLVGNMSGSTIACVMRTTSDACRSDPALRELFRRVVADGLAIAAAYGFPLQGKLDPQVMLTRLLHHKPSLLQDYEQQRPMEIGEILLAPLAFARARNIAVPTLDALAALATKMAIDRGLFDPTGTEALWNN